MPPRLALHRFRTHRENGHTIDRVARALRIEIEAANGGDLVAPPFDARRRHHPEPVDVENSATNAVLRDFSDRGDTLVPHLGEALRRVGETPFFFSADHEPRLLQCRRHRRSLRTGPRRRDQYAHCPAQQRLEGLDALARELVMRLLGTERFALWIQRGRDWSQKRLQIREPALPVRGGGSDDGKDALRQRAGERRDQHRRARAGKATDPDALSGRRYALDERARGG